MTQTHTISIYLTTIFKKLKTCNIKTVAAEISFYLILSFFPFVMLISIVISLLPINYSIFIPIMHNLFPTFFANWLNYLISSLFKNIDYSSVSFGLFIFIWSASSAFNVISISLNNFFNFAPKRNFFLQRLISIFLMLSFIINLFFSIFIYELFAKNSFLYNLPFLKEINFIFPIINFFISPLFIFLSIFIVYKYSINYGTKLTDVLYGSLFFTITWNAFLYFFNFYFLHISQSSNLYGILSNFIFLLLAFFYTSIILLIGGIINASVYEIRYLKNENYDQ